MLMFALMLGPILAGTPSVPLSDSDTRAAAACQARLTAKFGEISAFSVRSASHHRSRITLNGILNVNDRPPQAAPGLMTPTHVVVTPYSFNCRVHAGRVERVRTVHAN